VFTGIIECKGVAARLERVGGGMSVEIYAPDFGRDMAIGDSVAADGVCLTVSSFIRGAFLADVSEETLVKTTLGRLRQGDEVNLERALRLSDRLGGHLMSGHVDGVGELVQRRPAGNSSVYQFRAPTEVLRYLAPKGSVAVDGISLTIVDLLRDGFTVAVIRHTEENTTLKGRPMGASVNMEADLIAKYVARFTGTDTAVGTPATEEDSPRGLGDMLKDFVEGR